MTDLKTAQYLKEKYGPFEGRLLRVNDGDRFCDLCGNLMKVGSKQVEAKSIASPEKPSLFVCVQSYCGKSLFGPKTWALLLFSSCNEKPVFIEDDDFRRADLEASAVLDVIVHSDAAQERFHKDSVTAVAIAKLNCSDSRGSMKWDLDKIKGVLFKWERDNKITLPQLQMLSKYNKSCKRDREMEEL